ncbi:hypothetical protein THAOC_24834 [Thalassiosira oceanica]|uniref:Uncharacterized protein n=1 Tax=Thalassiosira oceanica TaxID=159749 RepID=K0RST5_THAOC|nr:hypothetical protein THAOC_24834 [Thalassiosira oceanica]|eukprot:EJK55434.1 hypothetical protein THAOC_24834 [Thalassiosira oceanica]
MVAYALGDADGDAALVQLVHVEAERRAVDIMRDFMDERRLGETVRRAGGVAGRIEERYTSSSSSSGDGEGLFGGLDETNLAGVMGLGQANTDIASKRALAQRDDCGFASEVGNLADVDASQEEWALVMQSTESYERFIRHAVEEVCKARRLRREQRREERRRLEEAEEAKGRDAGDAMAGGSARSGSRGEGAGDEDDGREDRVDILPPHTGENAIILDAILNHFVSDAG